MLHRFIALIAVFTAMAVVLGTPQMAQAVDDRRGPEAQPEAQPEATALSAQEEQALASAVAYDESEGFEYDAELAVANGAPEYYAEELGAALESMTPDEAAEFAEAIGFNPGEMAPRALPAALLAVVAVLGTAAAYEISRQVTNYGIATACQNLEGEWAEFDSFCEINGHI